MHMKKAAAAPKTEDGAQNVTVRIQKRKLRELDELAKRTGVVRSAHIQLAISQYLERNGGSQ